MYCFMCSIFCSILHYIHPHCVYSWGLFSLIIYIYIYITYIYYGVFMWLHEYTIILCLNFSAIISSAAMYILVYVFGHLCNLIYSGIEIVGWKVCVCSASVDTVSNWPVDYNCTYTPTIMHETTSHQRANTHHI